MPDYVTVNVQGLDKLQAALEELPQKVAKKGIRKALAAGGNLFKASMVALAPKRTGFLSEHFGVKVKMNRNELAGTAFIGPQGKMDYPEFMSGAYKIKRVGSKLRKVGRIAVASVARFLEFGTSKMSKKPFMTQAFESDKDKALEAVTNALKASLDLT